MPEWLYDSRIDRFGDRVIRIGSRKIGVVANYISSDAFTSPALLGSAWRFHFSLGPFGGVQAGFDYAGIRGRIWSLRGGRGLGLGWGPR